MLILQQLRSDQAVQEYSAVRGGCKIHVYQGHDIIIIILPMMVIIVETFITSSQNGQ